MKVKKKILFLMMLAALVAFPIMVQAQANLPSGTINTNPVYRATYSITKVGITPVTTDLVTLQGSATKTIQIKKVVVGGTSTSGGASADVAVVKRTVTDSGGTAGTVPSITKYDSADPTATATPAYYTVAPTAGTGVIVEDRILNKGVAGSAGQVEFTFSNRNDKPLRLHGIAEWMAINFNSATVTSGDVVSVTVEWEEY